MPKSKYVRSEDGDLFLHKPDGTEARLAGVQRMHFYRLAGVTLEEASDEQVERYFALTAQEKETGQRATPVRKNESAADMVARELRILNLPQVLSSDQPSMDAPAATPPPAPASPTPPRAGAAPPPVSRSGQGLPPPPRYQASQGLPPPPRYTPQAAAPSATAGSRATGGSSSRFLRQEGSVLYLQAPDGTEQRVTQYMRVHFNRMLEKEITEATDQDIEMWWKLQGSLDPGATLPEAQNQNLLTEALKAAGKLKRAELEVLHQTVGTWLEARRETS